MTRYYHELSFSWQSDDADIDRDDKLFAEWLVTDTRRAEIIAIGHMDGWLFIALDPAVQSYLFDDAAIEHLRDKLQRDHVGVPNVDWRVAS